MGPLTETMQCSKEKKGNMGLIQSQNVDCHLLLPSLIGCYLQDIGVTTGQGSKDCLGCDEHEKIFQQVKHIGNAFRSCNVHIKSAFSITVNTGNPDTAQQIQDGWLLALPGMNL